MVKDLESDTTETEEYVKKAEKPKDNAEKNAQNEKNEQKKMEEKKQKNEKKNKINKQKKKSKKTGKLIKYFLRLPIKLVVTIIICGYIVGVAITVGWFMFIAQNETNEKFITKWIIWTTIIFIFLLLTYSRHVRCIVVLTLPVLFSTKGRSLILGFAFILAATGPIVNIVKNVDELATSLTCGENQLKEAISDMLDVMKRPLIAVKDAIKKAMAEVRKVMQRVKVVLLRIQALLMVLLAAIKNAYNWLNSLVSVCNKEFGTPFDRCMKMADDAIADCREKLGIFSSLCNVTKVFSMLCYTVKFIDVICVFVDFFSDKIIKTIVDRLKEFSEEIERMFDVSITFDHDFYFQTKASNDMKSLSKNILAEIHRRMKPIFIIVDCLDIIGTLLFVFVFLKAIYFKYKYLRNVRYNNNYITKEFIEIDEKRKEHEDEERALPLTDAEKLKYVRIGECRLTRREILRISHSIVFLSITSLQLFTICLADYSFYWSLALIARFGHKEANLEVPPYITVDVQGGGVAGDMYGGIVHAFEPMTQNYTIDSTSCLPNPRVPNYNRYIQIAALCITAWIMIFTQPYGLRLRHVVMRYFYPEISKRRALWLYNHILLKRETFFKFARRKIRRKLMNNKTADNFRFKDWLRVKAERWWCCKCCVRLLLGTKEQDTCLICAKALQDADKVKCSTLQCPGIYCKKCFEDSKAACCICKNPMDYGDLTDTSQEIDSSELDEVKVHESERICGY